MTYDVIIIGGGTSGLMAAVSASEEKKKVLIIEKNATVGKKLLMTGGGRCNVTNRYSVDFIISNIIRNGKFLYSAFSRFNNQDIIQFFEKNGLALKEEDHGRMFPVTNRSKSVLDTLLKVLEKNHVSFLCNTTVTQIHTHENYITHITLASGKTLSATHYILATGGVSYPQTGSTGDGYQFAQKMHHTIIPPQPSEVALVSSEPFIQNKTLMGISLKNIELSVLNQKGKKIVTHQLDMLFTHFGVSGPAVLRCSSFVLNQKYRPVTLQLDSLPHMSTEDIQHYIQKEGVLALKQFLPERFLKFLAHDTPLTKLTGSELSQFIQQLKQFKFTVDTSLPIEKSFVTQGGISTKEIDAKTMRSKYIDNLYFCGELIDINGYTGGYNITAAFVTGYTAGKTL